MNEKEGGNFFFKLFLHTQDYLEMNSIIHLGSSLGKPIVK